VVGLARSESTSIKLSCIQMLSVWFSPRGRKLRTIEILHGIMAPVFWTL